MFKMGSLIHGDTKRIKDSSSFKLILMIAVIFTDY